MPEGRRPRQPPEGRTPARDLTPASYDNCVYIYRMNRISHGQTGLRQPLLFPRLEDKTRRTTVIYDSEVLVKRSLDVSAVSWIQGFKYRLLTAIDLTGRVFFGFQMSMMRDACRMRDVQRGWVTHTDIQAYILYILQGRARPLGFSRVSVPISFIRRRDICPHQTT